MVNPAPILSVTGLWLALLRRWFGLWTKGPPPARFVAGLEKTERELAQAIRATLLEDGVAFPDLADTALLQWFARHHPCSDKTALAFSQQRGPVARPVFNTPLDRRPPAGLAEDRALAGWKTAVRQARAPP